MRDLCSHIIKQYAVHWERLGLELGLMNYHIANILRTMYVIQEEWKYVVLQC